MKVDSEKLIELVSEQELLFDHSHKWYYDATKKEKAWKAIGEQMGQNAQKCKKHWTALRDGYRKNLRKHNSISDQYGTVKKKWRFEDEMSFLLPHLHERSSGSLNTPLSSSDESDHLAPNDDIERKPNIGNVSNPSIFYNGCDEETGQPTSLKKKRVIKERQCFVKKKRIPIQTAPVVIKCPPKNDNHTKDEVETLFYSLAQTVKRMDPYHRALAKSRICAIIGELEIESITNQTPAAACASSSGACASFISSVVSQVPSSVTSESNK